MVDGSNIELQINLTFLLVVALSLKLINFPKLQTG